jgi:hypothetical protein
MRKRAQTLAETSSKIRPRVFISNTVIDLPEHRAALVDACLRVGVEPLVMENLTADGSDYRTGQGRTKQELLPSAISAPQSVRQLLLGSAGADHESQLTVGCETATWMHSNLCHLRNSHNTRYRK